jgi:hypothetical protein
VVKNTVLTLSVKLTTIIRASFNPFYSKIKDTFVPVSNVAPHHATVWECEGAARHTCRGLVSFTPPSLNPGETAPGIYCIGGWLSSGGKQMLPKSSGTDFNVFVIEYDWYRGHLQVSSRLDFGQMFVSIVVFYYVQFLGYCLSIPSIYCLFSLIKQRQREAVW